LCKPSPNQPKPLKKALFFCLLACLANLLPAFAQTKLTGVVLDKKTNTPLPFASVSLKKATIGTATNDKGEFELLVPDGNTSDSLLFHYLGYHSQGYALSKYKNGTITKLDPQSFNLKEVVVRPLPPTYYILMAMRNIKNNYPNKPFQSLGYYREKIWENKQPIGDAEAVFKSYYPNYSTKTKSQHQLELYRKGKIEELKFIRKKIDKDIAKERKKALKKGETVDDRELAEMLELGGPETILQLDFIRDTEAFLDSNNFKKFDYKFGPSTIFQGKEVMVIEFDAKRTVDHQKQKGKVYLENFSYAIVSIEYSSSIVVPLLAKPVLFAMGYDVESPQYRKKYFYREIDNRWYPDYFHVEGGVTLTKRHLFDANEEADFKVEQFFSISKTETTGAIAIPEPKRYNPDKAFEDQIQTDPGIDWGKVNTVKR
jgi:hypothetical protein